ncbi:uncharacterized protein NP_4182A [Natronomonas pharaonis DSM 2160]|uniref:DUF7508 domain-containing protein n=1 Tax=Natronomonas pharaonis (strain ATCC 35678 / DSM 2160 / CIP 103997 / JCM 8858 / NBRC 14720 / NCIMB 2260 / Gabara) TaxID=348780 RepID=A0A1U7EY73_NATPD|nr:hypothetical protein [Natronomonas pharaonis]CAI50182.1 uncharacterized protein NP_4182A [Natronomonas pharaonis DSM 2160]
MPLQKPWQPLERSTIGGVPDRYGVYELGDGNGTVLAVEHGPLRDELKEALAYGDGSKVRWKETQTREQAVEIADTHRERLGE